MLIVYNPPTGANIKGFNYLGKLVESHQVSEMKYYEDDLAKALVETYPFLSLVSEDEAKQLKADKTEEVKAEAEVTQVVPETVPETTPAAPLYVSKKDKKVKEEKEVSDIPVAKVSEVEVEKDKATEIPDDLKGTDWYGEGPKET